jgi:hypothetical protein
MRTSCTRLLRLALVLAGMITPVYAAETGYTLRATEVKDKPFLDAVTLTTLAEKTKVEIVTRQGAWMQIRTANVNQAWIRMLSVRLGSPDQQPQSSGNLLSALGIASRPRPATTATVTTGVRGFSEEDLANAKPNAEEVQKLKSYASTSEEAAKRAENGQLSPRALAYFDENGKPLKASK